MQVAPTLDTALLGVPGIFIGLILGYYLGGYERFGAKDRIGLGIISSFFAGIITTVVLMIFVPTIATLEAIFIILSYFGGYVLGAVSNWAPTPEKPPTRHIVYEPDDDDDAFDREIEETLRGGQKANKS
jgi:hypothetical protein